MKSDFRKGFGALTVALLLPALSACNGVKVAQVSDYNGVQERQTSRTNLSSREQIFEIALKERIQTSTQDTTYSLTIYHPYSYRYDIAPGDSLSIFHPGGSRDDIICDSVTATGKAPSGMGMLVSVGGLGVPIPLGKGKQLNAWHYTISSDQMKQLLNSQVSSVNFSRAKGYKRRVIDDNKFVLTIDRCLRKLNGK